MIYFLSFCSQFWFNLVRQRVTSPQWITVLFQTKISSAIKPLSVFISLTIIIIPEKEIKIIKLASTPIKYSETHLDALLQKRKEIFFASNLTILNNTLQNTRKKTPTICENIAMSQNICQFLTIFNNIQQYITIFDEI